LLSSRCRFPNPKLFLATKPPSPKPEPGAGEAGHTVRGHD
jgi:hypothetical protein